MDRQGGTEFNLPPLLALLPSLRELSLQPLALAGPQLQSPCTAPACFKFQDGVGSVAPGGRVSLQQEDAQWTGP